MITAEQFILFFKDAKRKKRWVYITLSTYPEHPIRIKPDSTIHPLGDGAVWVIGEETVFPGEGFPVNYVIREFVLNLEHVVRIDMGEPIGGD